MATEAGADFNFSKLVVGDLHASADFYKSVFGLEEIGRSDADICGRKISEIMYKPTSVGGATFVLLAYADSPTPTLGETITGFMVADLEATVTAVEVAGGSVVDPLRSMPEVGVKVVFVRDVEGHLLEIVELL